MLGERFAAMTVKQRALAWADTCDAFRNMQAKGNYFRLCEINNEVQECVCVLGAWHVTAADGDMEAARLLPGSEKEEAPFLYGDDYHELMQKVHGVVEITGNEDAVEYLSHPGWLSISVLNDEYNVTLDQFAIAIRAYANSLPE
jgi:hypothetical protein